MDRPFYIANTTNGKVMDIECENTNPGARVIVYDKKGSNNQNQLWYEDHQDNIHAACNHFLLQATNPGEQLTMHPHNGDSDQQWRFKEGRIVNPSSGLCLDIRGSSVVASKQSDSASQFWRKEY